MGWARRVERLSILSLVRRCTALGPRAAGRPHSRADPTRRSPLSSSPPTMCVAGGPPRLPGPGPPGGVCRDPAAAVAGAGAGGAVRPLRLHRQGAPPRPAGHPDVGAVPLWGLCLVLHHQHQLVGPDVRAGRATRTARDPHTRPDAPRIPSRRRWTIVNAVAKVRRRTCFPHPHASPRADPANAAHVVAVYAAGQLYLDLGGDWDVASGACAVCWERPSPVVTLLPRAVRQRCAATRRLPGRATRRETWARSTGRSRPARRRRSLRTWRATTRLGPTRPRGRWCRHRLHPAAGCKRLPPTVTARSPPSSRRLSWRAPVQPWTAAPECEPRSWRSCCGWPAP